MSWNKASDQVLGPKIGEIGVVATGTTSAATSLETLLGVDPKRQFITVVSSQATHYAFGGASDAVSASATTGATRAGYLQANVPERMIATGTHIVHLAAATGLLRVWLSSDTC